MTGLASKATAQNAAIAVADTIYQPFDVDSVAGSRAGSLQLDAFLAMHLRKPFMAQVANAMGRVLVKGVVEPDGRFSSVAVLRGLRPDCDREALRVMRLFNFWKPAQKNGKPVRQAMVITVPFRANSPVYYENGNSLTYYNAEGWPTEPAKASQAIRLPVDTLTGLPTGDMRAYDVAKGQIKGETNHFVLIRQTVDSKESDGETTSLLGHKEIGGSNWIGTVHTLRADSTLLQTASADPQTGVTRRYARTGQVIDFLDHVTKEHLTFYPSGQPEQVWKWIPGDAEHNKHGTYQLMTAWDSTARMTIVGGSGHSISQQWTRSHRPDAPRTLLTEAGDYQGGERHGLWKGQTADGLYSYEERYENGRCLGGTAQENGQPISYEEAYKQPEFIGGVKQLYNFLADNIRYPPDAQRSGLTGQVYVSFTVCTDGSLCDFDVMRGAHPLLDKEALRVVKRMDKHWKPGSQRGKPVRVKYNLPISFRLN